MSKQYIAFFGLGKTTWCKSHLNWVDLDISFYNMFLDGKTLQKVLYYFMNWDYNLLIGGASPSAVDIILKYKYTKFPWQFNKELDTFKINIILPSREMKQEIIERLQARGRAEEVGWIINEYDRNWEVLDNAKFDTKVYLKPGQYLSDIIDENGEYKPGVEVIYGN